jgi:two-component system, OmpR family, sensor histidine kinase KdpD
MRATGLAGVLAGVVAVFGFQQFRSRLRENRGRGELDHFVDLLPDCPDIDQALAAAEGAFLRAFRLPLAVISKTDGSCVKRHTPGFLPGSEDLETARLAMSEERVIWRGATGTGYVSFVPLNTWRGTVGALVFPSKAALSSGTWKLIRSFADQMSLMMLRAALANQARDASWLSEADRFQKTLLNSIAHNVRTPLASIIGVLSTLEEDDAALNSAVRCDLVETARQEADRLNRLLGNLLDLSRIEARAVRVRADPCDVQDLIGAAIEQLGGRARDHSIEVQIDSNMPLVHMDFVLIVQVLVNLLDNAMKYSSSEAPIQVRAALADETLEVRVEDCGDGLAEEDLKNVFDKFNRAGRTGETGGIGLGLSICKGLVEAHSGKIWAERRCPHGTTVALRLPLSLGGVDDGQHHAGTCS